ncbi:MAG TPA: phosphatase PAP2 family protein, partial [Gemmatimonadaceae bacterium]|nr:phosphatase PAP2 family protein [Gemmatimonadaceae bacterium]
RIFGFLGSPGPFLVGGALFAAGRIADEPRLVRLAAHGSTAMLASLVATGVLKTTLGRARPSVSADTNPRDFRLFRGWTADAYQAFPSGHAALAFALAAATTAEIDTWNRDATWFTAPLLYGGATLVGLSRMYEDRHWPTDILAGAAIGTLAGVKAVRFSRTPTGRRLDRRLIGDDAQLRIGYLVRW